MSDIYKESLEAFQAENQACRVSYTCNNHQPVLCTYIGVQPLFYMDIDPGDAEYGFDAADYEILEGEIERLKNEIDTLEKFSGSFSLPENQFFEDYLYDASMLSSPFEIDDSKAALDKIIETIATSRMGQAYLEVAEAHNVKIAFSTQVETAIYDKKDGTLFLQPLLEFSEQVLLTVRELRRHWQHRQGALINPLLFHPDNAVLVHRAQVADLTVAMIRVAWEIQLSGCKKVWERLENSSLNDLAHAFAREAFLDFRTLNNGQASAAVFETWFLSERCRAEDKNLIKQMLADYQGYVFDIEVAEKSVTPSLIAALGEMPYGKNYLAQHADTIMNDSIFTDVRDRSNANFLWFIKFERSFRETEHDLQPGFPSQATGDRQAFSGKNIENQGFNHAGHAASAAQHAEIIHLFAEENTGADSSQNVGDNQDKKSAPLSRSDVGKRRNNRKLAKQKTADIVYLRRWSGE